VSVIQTRAVCACGRPLTICPEAGRHDAIEKAAMALYDRFPSEPGHFRSGVWWADLSPATRRSYTAKAQAILKAYHDALAQKEAPDAR
jgi:hypothetical protein